MNVLASDDLFIEFLQVMLDRGLIKDLEDTRAAGELTQSATLYRYIRP